MRIGLTFYPQNALPPWLDLLGQWRLKEFSTFPYLYDGTLADEERFSRAWARMPGASLVLATSEDGTPAGLCTGNPLNADLEAFAQKGYTPSEWFYLGEVIVAPECRGKGLAGQMIARMATEAKTQGFGHTCFLCVRRAPTHPLKPMDYQGPDRVWQRLGYRKLGIETAFKWRAFDVGRESFEQEHVMEYWGI